MLRSWTISLRMPSFIGVILWISIGGSWLASRRGFTGLRFASCKKCVQTDRGSFSLKALPFQTVSRPRKAACPESGNETEMISSAQSGAVMWPSGPPWCQTCAAPQYRQAMRLETQFHTKKHGPPEVDRIGGIWGPYYIYPKPYSIC